MPPANRRSVASLGVQCLVGLAEFLPEHLTSNLESKLTVPPDYVHHVINEHDITILAKRLLHPI